MSDQPKSTTESIMEVLFGGVLIYFGWRRIGKVLYPSPTSVRNDPALPAGVGDPGLGRAVRTRVFDSEKYGKRVSRVFPVRNLDDRLTAIIYLIRQGEGPMRAVGLDLVKQFVAGGGDSTDHLAFLKWLFPVFKARISYSRDNNFLDTFQDPWLTWDKLHGGDCDDHVIVWASICAGLGIPGRLVVVRTRGNADWNHIYFQAGLPARGPSQWLTLDTTVKDVQAGWEVNPRDVLARKVRYVQPQ